MGRLHGDGWGWPRAGWQSVGALITVCTPILQEERLYTSMIADELEVIEVS